MCGQPAIRQFHEAFTLTTNAVNTPLVHFQQQPNSTSTIVYHGKRYLEPLKSLPDSCFFSETLSSPSDTENEKPPKMLQSMNTIVSRCTTQIQLPPSPEFEDEVSGFSPFSDSEYTLLSVSSPSSLSTDSI